MNEPMNELEAALKRIVKEIGHRVWREGAATQNDDWELITKAARLGAAVEKYKTRAGRNWRNQKETGPNIVVGAFPDFPEP
jgi:hypothetical protein